MAPLVVLMYLPILSIVLIIIAIIRLIVRASSSSSSNNNTNYNQYRQPPNTGQQNPYGQQNQQPPYGQQNQQNPYVNPPQDLNNPQPWQNPNQTPIPPVPPADTNQPTDYTLPNYNQQNYTQPNYNQPNYTQPNYTQPNYSTGTYTEPGGQKRSTSIQNNYATHVGAPATPKSNKRTMIIVFSIIGVVLLFVGGIIYVSYQRSNGAASLVGESFYLAYENPTANTYYIVLDEWDTIKVDPYTTCENLDYTHRRDLTTFHWQMLDESKKVFADTTVTEDEMNSWMSDRTAAYWGTSTVLFNPSLSEYVYYTAWYDEDGTDYMDDVKVGDSTYYCDAYVVKSPFIFDGRDTEYQVDLGEASNTSTLDQNQFLVSASDFVVLYDKLNNDNTQQGMMENYRAMLADLYEVGKEEVMVNPDYDVDDLYVYYALDSLTPSYVSSSTEPRDFVDAIELVKDNASLFRSTAREQYNYIVDSADVLLKHSYVETDVRPGQYLDMTVMSYTVYHRGMLADQPEREVGYSYERTVYDPSE